MWNTDLVCKRAMNYASLHIKYMQIVNHPISSMKPKSRTNASRHMCRVHPCRVLHRHLLLTFLLLIPAAISLPAKLHVTFPHNHATQAGSSNHVGAGQAGRLYTSHPLASLLSSLSVHRGEGFRSCACW